MEPGITLAKLMAFVLNQLVCGSRFGDLHILVLWLWGSCVEGQSRIQYA